MSTEQIEDGVGYKWGGPDHTCAHAYTLPIILRELKHIREKRVFDLGCGNGATLGVLAQKGWKVAGVDPSEEGILQAKAVCPDMNVGQGSAYDDLSGQWGQFPVVISLDVVEHVFYPRKYAKTLFSLVEPGGRAILSTPFHGYWKNLVLAIMGKMDDHFTALWDYGHIKFWSEKTLAVLLKEAGFKKLLFQRAGRLKPIAKTMICVAYR